MKASALGLMTVFTLVVAGSVAPAGAQQLAFPTAGGAGAYASGGRGGDVYHVTNLLDTVSVGTLRYGIEKASGPRTIVFDVGGAIYLQKHLSIGSDMTLAGQTAPGEGIAVYGYYTTISNVSNVIVQHMRFRCGDLNAIGNPAGNGDLTGSSGDALHISSSQNVIVDHVSTSWSMDETLSVNNSGNVTVQYSVISEALENSYHDKGAHSYASILATMPNTTISYHHNLLANTATRMPRLSADTPEDDPAFGTGYKLDIRNNVIYNWGSDRAGYSVEGSDNYTANYAGNVLQAGPESGTGAVVGFRFMTDDRFPTLPDSKLYVADNLVNGANIDDDFIVGTYTRLGSQAAMDGAPVKTQPALLAAQIVLDHVGALSGTKRDSVDARVVSNYINRTGALIDSQTEVGGYPTLTGGTAPLDTDRDGMPDQYEIANGLSYLVSSDRNGDKNGDGWTNLENYLHTLLAPHEYVSPNFVDARYVAKNDAKIQGLWDSPSNPTDYRNVNYGQNDTLTAREQTGNPIRMSKSYVSFDLPANIDEVISGSVEFYWDRTNEGSRSYKIFGLVESNSYGAGDLGEKWGENELTWLNAPGNFNDGLTGGFDPAYTVYLGEFTSGASPGWLSVTGQALLNLLNADTNGTVTFLIAGTALGQFQSSERIGGNAPQLNLLYSEVPEPASLALMGLGSLGLLLRRCRR